MAKYQSLVMAGGNCDDSVFFIIIEHKQKINSYSSKPIITTKLDIALI